MIELLPTAIFRLIEHFQIMHDEIIRALGRGLALRDIAAHGDVQEYIEIGQFARPLGDGRLHDRIAVDVPHHAALAARSLILVPCELEAHGSPLLHARHERADDAVFPVVLWSEEAPVQTRVVDAVTVPGFGNVDLAVVGP